MGVQIEKQFVVARSRDAVWDAFGDVHLVAACLPGASIVEDRGDGRYKGRFTIKLGPIAAAFDGDVEIERKATEWMAVVSGKGMDPRSASRANGSMTYRLAEEGNATRVDVTSEINLAGALAQFGKAGVIQEIANRITAEFVRNFEAKLAPAESAAPLQQSDVAPTVMGAAHQTSTSAPPEQASLNAGALLWSIVRDRVGTFFDRLLGRK